jgi:hypothetical protein
MAGKRNIAKASLIGLLIVAVNLIPLKEIFGITSTIREAGVMPTIYLIPMFFVYGFIALAFSNIKNNLNLGKGGAFITVFSFLFTIDILLTNIEGNFYIENYPLAFNLIYGFLKTTLITIGVFCLWKQEDAAIDAKELITSYFESRSIPSWTWRLATVLILSFIIYMILGAIAYPLTGPYMEELIEIPSMLANFTVTMLRGVAYLLVTIPIIIFWKESSKNLFLTLALINILLYPVLGYVFAYFFPAMFRLIDGVVLTLHVTAMSWLQTKLLKRGGIIQ